MEINTKQIASFLRNLNDAETNYTQDCLRLAEQIRILIKKYNLSKNEVCEIFHIHLNKYNDYIKGARNYDLMDMSRLNAAFIRLESEKLKDKAPVQINPPISGQNE